MEENGYIVRKLFLPHKIKLALLKSVTTKQHAYDIKHLPWRHKIDSTVLLHVRALANDQGINDPPHWEHDYYANTMQVLLQSLYHRERFALLELALINHAVKQTFGSMDEARSYYTLDPAFIFPVFMANARLTNVYRVLHLVLPFLK